MVGDLVCLRVCAVGGGCCLWLFVRLVFGCWLVWAVAVFVVGVCAGDVSCVDWFLRFAFRGLCLCDCL